jgi:hypothetical protein
MSSISAKQYSYFSFQLQYETPQPTGIANLSRLDPSLFNNDSDGEFLNDSDGEFLNDSDSDSEFS